MIYIYAERESKNLEFKSQIPAFLNLIKTCVAFANGAGGKIIIGVEDKTRKIIGINDEVRNRIYDEFPNSVYDATSPSLLVEIYEKRFENLSIIIIEVFSSIKKPVFITKEGIPNGVYLRAGSSTRKANQEYIEELKRENKRLHHDEEAIVQIDIDVLSQKILKNIFKKHDITRLLNEKIVAKSPSNNKKYSPTIAGLLMFCETPQNYISEAVIRCTRFQGKEGREIIQSEEIHGNLEQQIETSLQLLKSWLTRDYKLLGAQLKGKMLIPQEALREAIANAVIHRKYWIPGAVKIALYDDRLEIFSPGNFPGLFDISNLGDGTTYLRNPHIAKMARYFGIIEQLGTGIKVIFDSCHKAGIKKPEFIEGADSVKVIFSFLPMEKDNLSTEETLFSLFHIHSEIKVDDVERYLNVSRNTATRKLNQLIELGKIKRTGKGPAVRYKLS